jgi:cardiolipin synthase
MTGKSRRKPRRGATEVAMGANAFLDERLGALRAARFRPAALARFGRDLWRRSGENARDRPDLRRELLLILLGGVALALAAGLGMMAEGVPPVTALVVPVGVWVVLCAWVRVELGLVRHPISGDPSPAIGPANVLSMFRGWAAAPVVVMGVYRTEPSLVAVALGLAAGITDLVDGTVAVRLGQESRLGRLLDPVLDSFLFSAIAFTLSRWGLLPWWMAALVAFRYFVVVLGGIVLLFALGRTLPVRHTPWGQRSTLAIAMSLLATVLSKAVPVPAVVLAVLYVLTVVTVVLALVGIVRQAPVGGGAEEVR